MIWPELSIPLAIHRGWMCRAKRHVTSLNLIQNLYQTWVWIVPKAIFSKTCSHSYSKVTPVVIACPVLARQSYSCANPCANMAQEYDAVTSLLPPTNRNFLKVSFFISCFCGTFLRDVFKQKWLPSHRFCEIKYSSNNPSKFILPQSN